MAKCEGATFARSLAFMPLINQAYLSPSFANAHPLRPPRGSCVYAYCVRCPPLPTVATLPYIMVAPRVILSPARPAGGKALRARG